MKFKDSKAEIAKQEISSVDDITGLYIKFQNEHRNVYITKMGEKVFIYRSLGRAEYKKILDDPRFKSAAKEELICEVCVLWPEKFDFEDCDAGIPSVLCQEILKNSGLDKAEARTNILTFYRNEMWDIDNQMTCLINEAFPNIDIEEIESWDMEKTCKYLSRAEWKLHNLRGMKFNDAEHADELYGTGPETAVADGAARQRVVQPRTATKKPPDVVDKQQLDVPTGSPEKADTGAEVTSEKTIRGSSKKEKLTPEKIRELSIKYPGIDWGNDAVVKDGIEAFSKVPDTSHPALRAGS